eukprot:865371_1
MGCGSSKEDTPTVVAQPSEQPVASHDVDQEVAKEKPDSQEIKPDTEDLEQCEIPNIPSDITEKNDKNAISEQSSIVDSVINQDNSKSATKDETQSDVNNILVANNSEDLIQPPQALHLLVDPIFASSRIIWWIADRINSSTANSIKVSEVSVFSIREDLAALNVDVSVNNSTSLPILIDGKTIIYEQLAIIRYIFGKFDSRLYPDSITDRALMNQSLSWISTTFSDIESDVILPYFGGKWSLFGFSLFSTMGHVSVFYKEKLNNLMFGVSRIRSKTKSVEGMFSLVDVMLFNYLVPLSWDPLALVNLEGFGLSEKEMCISMQKMLAKVISVRDDVHLYSDLVLSYGEKSTMVENFEFQMIDAVLSKLWSKSVISVKKCASDDSPKLITKDGELREIPTIIRYLSARLNENQADKKQKAIMDQIICWLNATLMPFVDNIVSWKFEHAPNPDDTTEMMLRNDLERRVSDMMGSLEKMIFSAHLRSYSNPVIMYISALLAAIHTYSGIESNGKSRILNGKLCNN